MRSRWGTSRILAIVVIWALCGIAIGCAAPSMRLPLGTDPNTVPRELRMTPLPAYQIEVPDILIIDMLSVVPKPPYQITPLDFLLINVSNTLPSEPIAGLFGVEPDGNVNLGPSYGLVRVAGLTLDAARAGIQKHLAAQAKLKDPQVAVSLAQAHAMQQIRGEHLVRPDGTVELGTYGSVYVAGMTVAQAKAAIEEQLRQSLLQPEIFLDVYAYNSKHFFVIADGAGYGQIVLRLPITGNDTVLDAISQIYGLPQVSSPKRIWVARPNGNDPDALQILPVDWCALTKGGSPATNYQLLPGDRVYLDSNRLIALNNHLAQLFAPIERVLGVTLLGSATVGSIQNNAHGGTASSGSGAGGF
jgi:polysaccharide export outer membrane protein